MIDLEISQIPTIEDVPSLRQHKLDAEELLRAGIYQFAGRFVGSIFDNAMGTGEHSPEKKLHSLQFNWLLDQIPSIQHKLDILLKSLPLEEQPVPSDISALFEAATRVSRKTADSRKRKLLKSALVNAFDKDLYNEGITLRLMEALENLYYGDIQFLNRMKCESKTRGAEEYYFQEKLDDLELHHVEMLEKESLLKVERGAIPYQITIRSLSFKLLQLVEE